MRSDAELWLRANRTPLERELLGALESCQRELRKLSFTDSDINRALGHASAAIAKARGKA